MTCSGFEAGAAADARDFGGVALVAAAAGTARGAAATEAVEDNAAAFAVVAVAARGAACGLAATADAACDALLTPAGLLAATALFACSSAGAADAAAALVACSFLNRFSRICSAVSAEPVPANHEPATARRRIERTVRPSSQRIVRWRRTAAILEPFCHALSAPRSSSCSRIRALRVI